MPAIRIRVGASLDRSVDVVFSNVEKRAGRAQQRINQALSGGRGGRRGGPYREAADEADRAARKTEQAANRAARAQTRSLQLQARGFKQLANVAAREMARVQRAEQRASEQAGRSFARRTSHRATRFLTPNAPIASFAGRVGRDLLRGAGIDFNIGNSIGKSIQLNKAATALSNQGFQLGAEGPAGTRVSSGTLVSEARKLADESKGTLRPEEIIQAQQAFVDITGNLDSARKSMGFLGRLSIATGTNLEAMAAAAANVDNQLADTPDKAKRLESVMKAIAGQGKIGAVEIKDLAKQMARIAAVAPSFEGDVATNVTKLGALAQLSRAMGGSPSSAEAARSVGGFANTLQKGARIDAFKAVGVDVFADKGHTKFKDPFQLIRESLKATNGDLKKMNLLFMDVVGARAVRGLANVYNQAGGGAAGETAVNKQFSRFTGGAALTDQAINDAIAEQQKTDAAKAQNFQNQLDKIAASLAEKVLPALEKLAPTALDLVAKLGDMTTWVVENPKKAIGLAITASIARAGLESAFRSGIEQLLLGPRGGAGVGGAAGRASAVGKAAATAGSLMTIAATAVSITAAGMVTIDALAGFSDKRNKKDVETGIGITNIESAARNGSITKEQADELKRVASQLQGRRKLADELAVAKGAGGLPGAAYSAVSNYIGGKSASQIYGAFTEDSGKVEGELKRVQTLLNDLKSGTLQVRVTNPEDMKDGAGVNPSGREPPPGSGPLRPPGQ